MKMDGVDRPKNMGSGGNSPSQAGSEVGGAQGLHALPADGVSGLASTATGPEVKTRPSSLPMLRECPQFQSGGPERDYADAGTARHEALRAYVESRDAGPMAVLPMEDREGVEWAAEYIRLAAPLAEHPQRWETGLELIGEDFEVLIAGTPDLVCGDTGFDLKWRWRDYEPQIACYALMEMERTGRDHMTWYVLYAEPRKVMEYRWTREEAAEVVLPLIYSAGEGEPQPCDYCDWCAHALTCPALTERAAAVAQGREDWRLENYHSSQILEPGEMAKALRLARELKAWCEAVEYQAREMATKQGRSLPGFKLQNRRGKKAVTDITLACRLSGLPAEEFLGVCSVQLGKLEERYAEINGMKKAPAKRELEAKLAGVIAEGKPSQSLVKDKKGSATEDTESTEN